MAGPFEIAPSYLGNIISYAPLLRAFREKFPTLSCSFYRDIQRDCVVVSVWSVDERGMAKDYMTNIDDHPDRFPSDELWVKLALIAP
jgi:hypothetical protein